MFGIYRYAAVASTALTFLFGNAEAQAQGPVALSVLTYNIEGLPWPIRTGRAAALTRIAQQLQAMRAANRQPRVIVLEEAFSTDAKAIAVQAGYRYIADGPAAGDAGAVATSPADKAFVSAASFLSGEKVGKWSGSGLRVASDFPILSVKRMAYPIFACAGLDCLANKGALLVTVAVPGIARPVAIVATHLNSRAAARVSYGRSFHAFQRQIDALSDFVRTGIPPTMPFIVAGDFNAGQEPRRRAYLLRHFAQWRATAPVHAALDTCFRQGSLCSTGNRNDLLASWRSGRDWQIFASGRAENLMLKSVVALFGHGPDRHMLSDHIGYAATYIVGSAADRGKKSFSRTARVS